MTPPGGHQPPAEGGNPPLTLRNPAKVPGAVSGTSGAQVVDCPLGAKCPDGGHHQMGSQKLMEHTAQAQHMAQVGKHPTDESTGQGGDKPGLMPGSQNMGSIGSDKAGLNMQKPSAAGKPMQKPTEQKPEGEAPDFEAVHREQSQKAAKMLVEATAKHEKTKAQMDKIKQQNSAKQKEYSEAKSAGKPAIKPKLAKEPKIEEKPEFYAPSNDAEKLQNENHSFRAKKVASNLESHLKSNSSLSPDKKKKLERAHKMAAFHANLMHVPTPAHKKELKDLEQYAKNLGADKPFGQEESGKKPAAPQGGSEQAEAVRPEVAAAQHSDHSNRAKQLQDNINSHMQSNPNMGPAQKEHAQKVLEALQAHQNMQAPPNAQQMKELRDLHGMAGTMQKPYQQPTTGGGDDEMQGVNMDNFALQQLQAGRQAGAGMAASATSPYGAAGQLGPQIVNYGINGATSAGHSLLRTDIKNPQQEEEAPAQKQKQPTVQASESGVK